MASQFAFSTKLCLPSASHGPFGSIPPVEMMTVVLPAFIASRTSIHVISSSQTVSGGVSGFGVSTQLYGIARCSGRRRRCAGRRRPLAAALGRSGARLLGAERCSDDDGEGDETERTFSLNNSSGKPAGGL